MRKFKQVRFVYRSERLLWCVLDTESTLPALLPLVWLSLARRSVAEKTLESDMTAIALFYDYLYEKHGIECETLIARIGLNGIIGEIIGFSAWMGSRNIGKMSNNTAKIRINAVCKFVQFLNDRHSSSRYMVGSPHEIRREHASIKNLIKSTKESISGGFVSTFNVSPKKFPDSGRFRSLDVEETNAVLKIILPSTTRSPNPLNPWKSKYTQIRNYLIVKVLLDYGLRKGELLLLTTKSCKTTKSGGYVIIITDSDDKDDNRAVKPRIKNWASHRIINITKNDYNLISFYISEIRNKPSYPNTNHLFVSNKGNPLGVRYIQTLCDDIYQVINENFLLLTDNKLDYPLLKISPHMFRHTWATESLHALVNDEGYDLKHAQDLLRELGGWVVDSSMPERYGRRFISDAANKANLRRISEYDMNVLDELEKGI